MLLQVRNLLKMDAFSNNLDSTILKYFELKRNFVEKLHQNLITYKETAKQSKTYQKEISK